jgi:hypothetical protein
MTINGLGALAAPVIEAKTAAYTVLPEDIGKIFTNRGASGSVTYTLPQLNRIQSGWNARFFVAAGQTIIVAAPANKLTTFNNATATSISFAQAGELIGNYVEIVYDGTTYLCLMGLTAEAVTISVA